MKQKLFVGLACFFLVYTAMYAQQQTKLEGKIIADSLDYTFINIINKTSHSGTTNAADGSFSILVKENDTLSFSSVQYQDKEVVISKSIFQTGFLEVILVTGVTSLEEVYLSNSKLTGSITTDFKNVSMYDKYALAAPMRRYDMAPLIDQKIAATGGDPSNLLLNTISGDRQRLKKIKSNMEYDSRIEKAIDLVSESYFKNDLEIPDDKIMLFLYHCADDPQFEKLVISESSIELMQFLKEKYHQFKSM
ncbi:hypothetical protein [Zunongwangia sp.]|uniref:hypothetical protein n=1 Tax=Zunongwangia sp. TaxID=1965325 RepID=UPI003AA7B595